MSRYPTMKFRVSSNDFFRRTAIIVEVNDISIASKKRKTLARGLPVNYWDFISGDAQQDENHVNRRVLSPGQVAPPTFQFCIIILWILQICTILKLKCNLC